MINDNHIAEVVAGLVAQHGVARALEVANRRANVMLDQDNIGGAMLWLEVARVVLGRPRDDEGDATRH